MKILILASNPRKDLNLDDEVRLLKRVMERSRDRDQFEVVSEPGVQVEDLQWLLLRHQPQIVHFCGHGSGEAGLIFKAQEGGERWVRSEALADLFRLNPICSHVRCVLLNACYSEAQADAIVSGIDYVVGMSHEIQDKAAIAFSKGFYLALGEGCSIEDAFEFGKNAIQLEITGSSRVRSSATEEQRRAEVVNAVAHTKIPEHLKPILKKRSALIANQSASSQSSLSPEQREEIQLEVDRALAEEETSLDQFREQVQEYLAKRKLEDYEKVFLEQLRQELGLSIEDAEKIMDEEYLPIRKGQEAYVNRLQALIDGNFYPFDGKIEASLRTFQFRRGLTLEEVEKISKPILEAAEIAYQEKRRQNFVEALGNGVTLEMVFISGGTFIMGQTEGEKQQLIQEAGEEHYQDFCAMELPQHKVTVQPFFMGKFAVTQEQWKAVAALPKVNRDLDPDPSTFKSNRRPVEQVSWHEAVEFCDRLSQKTGRQYRLPSEAEWEYACRAGTTTPFYCGETLATDLANYDGNSTYGSGETGVYRKQTTDVGSFPPNAFGLYDMHGNVWEWCLDHWHENYEDAPIDGSAWITGGESGLRMGRGGSWNALPRCCRSAYRDYYVPDNDRDNNLGFRVVCGLA
jgi:formylglycine-generating enzyme required for sulfatase activity